jgi:CheY-like chemotaxis protein
LRNIRHSEVRAAVGKQSLSSRIASTAILVAERGDPIGRKSLSELFRDEGYQVYEAGDSNSAVSQIHNNPGMKVLMLDVEMPLSETP